MNKEIKYDLVYVNSKKDLDNLRNHSALTVVGMDISEDSVKDLLEFFEDSIIKDNIKIYYTKGSDLNNYSQLTGTNAYNKDLNMVLIDLDNFNMNKLMKLRMGYFGSFMEYFGLFRWFDDVCDNNERREIEKRNR